VAAAMVIFGTVQISHFHLPGFEIFHRATVAKETAGEK
jgi:hypothetical protein